MDKLMFVCNVCKENKNFDDFYKDKSKAIGISYSCKSCSKKVVSLWHKNNREKSRSANKKTRENRKLKVLQYYSNSDKPICSCNGCYVQDTIFLALDHIYGDGADHRKKEGITSGHLYNWVVKNNFPAGFQVLCHNCNFAKAGKSVCPIHKENLIINFNKENDIGCRIGIEYANN